MPIKHAKRVSYVFSGFVGGLVIGSLAANQYYQFMHLRSNCNYSDPNHRNDRDVSLPSCRALCRLFFSSPSLCCSGSASVSGAEAQEQPLISSRSSWTEGKIPKDSKSRFLKYARRDEETGEYVQYLEDFVACMLLTEPLARCHTALYQSNCYKEDPKEKRNVTQAASYSASALQQFPLIVQTRMKNFFTEVDLDHNGKINYPEFVMLFTMLSTRRSTLYRAFRLFDLDNNGRLSAPELVLLLNTIMVDPAVQIRNVGRGGDRQGDQESLIISRKPPIEISERGSKNQGDDVKRSYLQVDSSAGHTSIFPSWLPVGAIFPRRNNEADKSLVVRPLGSSRTKDISLDLTFSSVEKIVFGPILRHRLAPPGFIHQWRTSKRKNYLEGVEDAMQIDAEERLFSFDLFWCRADFLRWELRAIEFGILDPENTGFIDCNDFHKILTHQVDFRSIVSAKKAEAKVGKQPCSDPASTLNGGGRSDFLPGISWQLYQIIFEIMREFDAVSHALQLTLDVEPHALASQLVAGAIPESKSEEVHDQIKRLTNELYMVNAKHAKNTLKKLVKPTGVTLPQLIHAFRSCDDIPRLTSEESELFFRLFDLDQSGTITPAEFSRLCEAKETFFAPYLPRFTECKRNKLQQFFHCMQQLE